MATANNLSIYNAVRKVPAEAQKPIQGGRLKGMTDINPMWRIKTLTEQFGPCGIGWHYNIIEKRIEEGANGEKIAFIDIELFVVYDGAWSYPIVGTGGSSFVSKEKNGLYTSDECFKMALTDALSVACKALGIGADVYYEKDRDKYSTQATQTTAKTDKKQDDDKKALSDNSLASDKQLDFIYKLTKKKNYSAESMASYIKNTYNKDNSKALTKKEASEIIEMLNALGA